jgi:tetratricopeptide (TPR) repeat protein
MTSMIRRDYIERLIERATQALAQIARLVATGQFDPALELVRRTTAEVLGPMGPVLERLDPKSAAALAGRDDVDRIRLYAALTCEEAAIHAARGRLAQADTCYRRALGLYEAASAGGARLRPADEERIAAARTRFETA